MTTMLSRPHLEIIQTFLHVRDAASSMGCQIKLEHNGFSLLDQETEKPLYTSVSIDDMATYLRGMRHGNALFEKRYYRGQIKEIRDGQSQENSQG